MAEQSRLENIGITKRDELVTKNDYANNKVGEEYSESHKDALADGDPKGKGSGISMGYAVADPDSFSVDKTGMRSQRINYSNLITHESQTRIIGGDYDRNGRSDLSRSGRRQLQDMNKYGDGHEYGADAVDTTQNVLAGQYKVQ